MLPRISENDYDALRRLWAHGVSGKRLARASGMSDSQFRYFCRVHRDDFPKRKEHRPATEAELCVAMRMRSEGKPYSEIAKVIGRDPSVVRRMVLRQESREGA